MTSRFVKISFTSGDMLRRSFPAIKGDASRHHKLKCARYSVVVIPPLPTSSMSGSFQCPGPACDSSPSWRSRIWTTPMPPQSRLQSQQSWMSPVVRQRLPTSLAHSHGFAVPHSQMLNTIGRPDLNSASRMIEYEAGAFCVLVEHQSYFR